KMAMKETPMMDADCQILDRTTNQDVRLAIKNLSLRRRALEQVHLWGLVRGRVDVTYCLGALSYRNQKHSRGVITVLLPLLRVFGSRLIVVVGAKYCSLTLLNEFAVEIPGGKKGFSYIGKGLVTKVHKAKYGNRLSRSTSHHFSSVFAYGASRSHRDAIVSCSVADDVEWLYNTKLLGGSVIDVHFDSLTQMSSKETCF
ncbi:hypothetical protein J6590_070531, partial [Homalodisca vitripennis]